MLDSFFVKNFRLFNELKVPHVGRINLIVGKNNAGKSCLLEALHIYGSEATLSVLYRFVTVRGEDRAVVQADNDEMLSIKEHPFFAFFPHKQFPEDIPATITIDPLKR